MNSFWTFFVLLLSLSFLLFGIEFLFLDIKRKKFSWRALLYVGSSLVVLFPGPALIKILPLVAVGYSNWKWRRPFNGGSDSLLFWLSFAFVIELLSPDSTYALLFVAVASVWSYFVAGLSKLQSPQWKSLETLSWALKQGCYSRPVPLNLPPWAPQALFGLQISAPLALFVTPYAWLFIFLMTGFHLWNFWSLGLNRFFWVWASTFPAILFAASYF